MTSRQGRKREASKANRRSQPQTRSSSNNSDSSSNSNNEGESRAKAAGKSILEKPQLPLPVKHPLLLILFALLWVSWMVFLIVASYFGT